MGSTRSARISTLHVVQIHFARTMGRATGATRDADLTYKFNMHARVNLMRSTFLVLCD